MEAHVFETLRQVGRQLDGHAFPRVANGGFVVLSEATVPLTVSTENDDDSKRERRPSAGSRPRTPGRQGTSRRSRSASDTAPILGTDLQAQVEVQLSELRWQYPGTQLWHQNAGYWLITTSRLLPGLRQAAIFLTGISIPWRMVRSWGFWTDPIAAPVWIGPRHTNYPDGSVCAFEPKDGTWFLGDPIVKLLDIYSLWAMRHLYLQTFGKWPGFQAAHHPAERLSSLRPDEHCGCERSERLYGDCCMPKDLARNRIRDALSFYWQSGGSRTPPASITQFVLERKNPPPLRIIEPDLKQYS